jgi:hypothetical protein
VQECVSLASRHVFIKAFDEIVSPGTILMAHPFMIHAVLLLAALKKSSCATLATAKYFGMNQRSLTGRDFFILEIDKFLETKDNYVRWINRGSEQLPEEV